MSGLWVLVKRLPRRVWFRAALFTIIAIVYALIAGAVASFVPYSFAFDLGQGAVGSILQILATSMLAVTTFSLTTMVTAYSSASAIATPRATQLLVEDTTSQNVLSTFIGAFTFSLVGIIALSTSYYTDQGRAILFLGTLVVIVIIVVTLLRWIGHLSSFGRMADVIDRVESEACSTLASYAAKPALGANVLRGKPTGSFQIRAPRVGVVTHVQLSRIESVAADADVQVHIVASAGRMTDAATPLARVSGHLDEDAASAIANAFQIDAHRTYEQDPRLGVIALSEIGSRALSPSTNDPGTAIEVLGSLQRVFTAMLTEEPDDEVLYPHVWITPVALDDLLEDAFRPLARDGAGMIEVALRLQRVLAALAATSPRRAASFRRAADAAARRAFNALPRADAATLRSSRRNLWG
ncbi:putative membrane protein [Microbacterium halimionae]|uniref:Putative membrane protein n=1 Tax=Microbacterium halimionae TaxID=1526413 RepID=A0A7W3JQ37_9MICO|nr:DUF2254 domain-containing protein [Microbacterium halimionae]MBA8816952.1 putative membrane protein [Microbacterium halimionae]NII94509.1 putative membrane protein [Microbacterium halimionae]